MHEGMLARTQDAARGLAAAHVADGRVGGYDEDES